MPLSDWWPCLVVALEAEEIEQRRNYWGEAKDYIPLFAPEEAPATTPQRGSSEHVIGKLMGFAREFGAQPIRGSVEALAQVRPDLARPVFVDERGRVVDLDGRPVEVPAGAVVMGRDGKPLTQTQAADAAQAGPMKLEDVLAAFGMKK